MAFSPISTQVSQNICYTELTGKKTPYWHFNGEHIPESDLSTLLRSQEQGEHILDDNLCLLIGERTSKFVESQRNLSHSRVICQLQ